jgi:hypothetical protein
MAPEPAGPPQFCEAVEPTDRSLNQHVSLSRRNYQRPKYQSFDMTDLNASRIETYCGAGNCLFCPESAPLSGRNGEFILITKFQFTRA